MYRWLNNKHSDAQWLVSIKKIAAYNSLTQKSHIYYSITSPNSAGHSLPPPPPPPLRFSAGLPFGSLRSSKARNNPCFASHLLLCRPLVSDSRYRRFQRRGWLIKESDGGWFRGCLIPGTFHPPSSRFANLPFSFPHTLTSRGDGTRAATSASLPQSLFFVPLGFTGLELISGSS